MSSDEFKRQVLPLSERIYPMVVRMLGTSENAEDAVQDIMVKLWNRRKKLIKHPNIPGFVFLTARNHCIDTYRRNRMFTQPLDGRNHADISASRHDEVEWNELISIVQDLLKELPEQQAEVLALRDLDGLEFSDIAKIMELRIENVRMLLSRARKKLSTKLLNIYNYEYGKEGRAAG